MPSRVHGRITKEDIRVAGLRRWNGRQRITTDWINLYHEPELCFPDGDCLVYLREPGQSSRGPSFRIHISQLQVKGFRGLVDRTIPRPSLHDPNTCHTPACEGCNQSGMRELYLPAPSKSSLDAIIDYHVTTRNFFAWLYRLPLAGRALGVACVSVKQRVDEYRPNEGVRNTLDITSFLEYHRYLDFRECVDHAIAALHVAETLELEDLWIDAFTHCVGMSNKGMCASLEFPALSHTTRAMITRSRLEMDVRLDRVSRSVMNFFESDLSGAFLGLHQAAREHFDRFRSFLHAFYIEQHGFWPPENFSDEAVKKSLYTTMYTDFRNLYHHLVDPDSTPSMDPNISSSGGVCTLQNIQAFDARHSYEVLPNPLPRIPVVPGPDPNTIKSRRQSLNPLKKSKASRDERIEAAMQALIDSSNRDWSIMDSLLVRRYSEFEQRSVFDEFEHVAVVDGRKVRWILIYAVLQTLISVMQAPTQVRNTEQLSYSLCVHPPKVMPWRVGSLDDSRKSSTASSEGEKERELEPDNNYSHTNSSSSSLEKARRKSELSMTQLNPATSGGSETTATAGGSRPSSLKRLLTRRGASGAAKSASSASKQLGFCEIFVPGYGNGLNEVIKTESSESSSSESSESSASATLNAQAEPAELAGSSMEMQEEAEGRKEGSVSRESSNASGYSSSGRSTGTDSTGVEDMDHLSVVDGVQGTDKEKGKNKGKGKERAIDRGQGITYEQNEVGTVYFNTETWDRILGET